MDVKAAGKRTKLGVFDGTILVPFFLMGVYFSYLTTGLFILFAVVNIYMNLKGRTMSWLLRRARFMLRNGVILARTPSFRRAIRG